MQNIISSSQHEASVTRNFNFPHCHNLQQKSVLFLGC